jgi:hypothetical protein
MLSVHLVNSIQDIIQALEGRTDKMIAVALHCLYFCLSATECLKKLDQLIKQTYI